MNVLLVKLNHLGDNVVFVPVVQALRARCPDWQLTLLTTPNEAGLYGGPLGPQEVVSCPKRAFDKSYRRPWRLARWIWEVRRRRPDACIVSFDQGTVAHLVAKLSGARIRIGGNLDFVRVSQSVTQEIPMPPDARPASWNWAMARALARALGREGGWPEAPPPPDFSFLLPRREVVPAQRKRVVVHAGAGKYLNRWPAERFAAVAASLARDFDVVWVDHEESAGAAPEGASRAVTQSVGGLAELLAGADLVLCNNSGPMHLASALGRPGVAVTGPSARGWDPYWHAERWTVLRHPDLSCAPCERPDRELECCANTASPLACLKYWTAQRVESICRERLRHPGSAQP